MDTRLDLILRQLDRLPTLPAVAVRILELGDAADAAAIGSVARDDPALSARILQMLNASANGVGQAVNDVPQAVALLGVERVRTAVMALAVFDTFDEPAGEHEPTIDPALSAEIGRELLDPNHRRRAFWEHCLAVACCGEILAPLCGVRPGEAYLAGLLHDLGKIALDAALPKSFQRVVEAAEKLRGDIAEVEREVVGMDHQLVGKRLAEQWGLPTHLRDVCWLHGAPALPGVATPLSDQTEHVKLVRLITLADRLVRERHIGYSGNHDFDADRAILEAGLDLTTPQVEAAVEQLMDTVGPRAAALGLTDESGGDLFRTALIRANRELGRVGESLSSKNRTLAARAKFFDALTDADAVRRPGEDEATVLRRIAQTAARVLDVPTAAAFVLRGDDADVCLATVDGETVARTSVASPPGDRSLPENADAVDPMRPVCPTLDWVINPISAKLGGPRQWWLPLTCEGRSVGGIVAAADAEAIGRLRDVADELAAISRTWALDLAAALANADAREAAEKLADSARRLNAAQEQALRARTLVALSQVAAGAAHEMNNPLMVISGRSQLLFQQLKQANPQAAAKAKLIFEQSQTLSDMISQLMEFAKPPSADVTPVVVSTLMEEAYRQAAARDDAGQFDRRTVRPTVPEGLPRANVDLDQVGGAIAEVLLNALQHTSDGGRIDLQAVHDSATDRIVLCVSDNGQGMPAEVRQHACEPFFSAQPAGRRRGMGLARALRRIDASGGWLRIESKPGHGTKVYILLPAAATEVDEVADAA
jgi:signal transduction histidine kinase/HD-like signal output (HDOD) protein